MCIIDPDLKFLPIYFWFGRAPVALIMRKSIADGNHSPLAGQAVFLYFNNENISLTVTYSHVGFLYFANRSVFIIIFSKLTFLLFLQLHQILTSSNANVYLNSLT